MKSPVTGKEMDYTVRKQNLIVKGVNIRYNHRSFYCPESEEYFTTTKLDEMNMKNAIYNFNSKVNKELPSYWWAIAFILYICFFMLLHK